jgi:hypothetical protein
MMLLWLMMASFAGVIAVAREEFPGLRIFFALSQSRRDVSQRARGLM